MVSIIHINGTSCDIAYFTACVFYFFFSGANMAHRGKAEIVGICFGVAPTCYLMHISLCSFKPVILQCTNTVGGLNRRFYWVWHGGTAIEDAQRERCWLHCHGCGRWAHELCSNGSGSAGFVLCVTVFVRSSLSFGYELFRPWSFIYELRTKRVLMVLKEFLFEASEFLF